MRLKKWYEIITQIIVIQLVLRLHKKIYIILRFSFRQKAPY